MSGFRSLVAGIEDLDDARSDARTARARLMGTVEEIQARMAPSQLLDEALSTARARSADMVQSASRAAQERPAIVAAAVAGVAMLLARKPLARLGSKLLRRGEETADTDHQFNP
jgi:hypothetical protein